MTKHLLCEFFFVIRAFCANFDYLRRQIDTLLQKRNTTCVCVCWVGIGGDVKPNK